MFEILLGKSESTYTSVITAVLKYEKYLFRKVINLVKHKAMLNYLIFLYCSVIEKVTMTGKHDYKV